MQGPVSDIYIGIDELKANMAASTKVCRYRMSSKCPSRLRSCKIAVLLSGTTSLRCSAYHSVMENHVSYPPPPPPPPNLLSTLYSIPFGEVCEGVTMFPLFHPHHLISVPFSAHF